MPKVGRRRKVSVFGQVGQLRSVRTPVTAQPGSRTVTAKIGEGGMGRVYQATDTKLNRHQNAVGVREIPY